MKRVKSLTILCGIMIGVSLGGSQVATATTVGVDEAEKLPMHAELPFHHPVSLDSATTVREGGGLPVLGYRFESDSIAGDFWHDGGLTVSEFLADIERKTGTAPEVVSAYVDGERYESRSKRSRSLTNVVLGAGLPMFDAPDLLIREPEIDIRSEANSTSAARFAAYPDTWWPNDAWVQITPMGQNLAIQANYSWYGYDPFAAPFVINDGWGMEFQIDFYTTDRVPNNYRTGPDTGFRPWCGSIDDMWAANYKDWAAVSNRPFDWFGYVISGSSVVAAPGGIGLYGDYNDLSDPCTVSTIAVGAADPGAIPSSSYATQDLILMIYPKKGMDAYSRVGSIVQPVSRQHCENNPSMPLTDCMGVTPGSYPGPGPAASRLVLNSSNGWTAPSLCWNSGMNPYNPTQVGTADRWPSEHCHPGAGIQ